MQTEIVIQVAFLLLTLGIFLSIYNLPKKALTKLRSSNHRAAAQSNRHFLRGAQLLSRARSTRNRPASLSLANDALAEADKALALQPRDPAAHILRGLAQDLLGHKSSALRSLDAALSPPSVKLLSVGEKSDALVKRAEIQMAVNRRRRIDSAVSDLVEAVALTRDNVKAFCLLGQCYEQKRMWAEAQKAYEEALKIEPECLSAREGLGRARS
ncbi:hypothetical protein Nepgr_026508 [Nepenthes gracilis]|uniref:Uncharacterized protein n=1 Tax=Nepenthes gracilis TaxID=150966 RepID=A0AAD3T713_NEPGR|nr:hypothetical protein Nepgr_026508 [Nepenthes gracilis]